MSVETIYQSPDHFEEYHTIDSEIICMQHNDQCCIQVEIIDTNPEEQAVLASAAESALKKLDSFFDKRFAELFSGLRIRIGDGLVRGGAEALPKENLILADRRKMLMSVADAEVKLSEYADPGDWSSVMGEQEAAAAGSSLEYNIIHETGHLLDEQTSGPVRHRVNPSESPTKYGRVADDWHEEKAHEAFAEGFTYMVYGSQVSETMEKAVRDTLKARVIAEGAT